MDAALPVSLKALRRLSFPHKLGILDRLYGKSLQRHGICWVETATGVRWKLDLAEVTQRWVVYGYYDGPGFFRWARSYLQPDATVIDSGANLGQVLLYLAPGLPKGKLLAFEPNPHAADWLAECLAINNSFHVELIRKGLGAKSEILTLFDGGLSAKHGAQGFVSSEGNIPISIVSLDDELSSRGINRVALWKLDVEGYEPQALEGAKGMLNGKQIGAVYAEIMQSGDQTYSILVEHGYHPYTIRSNGSIRESKLPVFNSNMLFLASKPW